VLLREGECERSSIVRCANEGTRLDSSYVLWEKTVDLGVVVGAIHKGVR
jgi:hypothetical protein